MKSIAPHSHSARRLLPQHAGSALCAALVAMTLLLVCDTALSAAGRHKPPKRTAKQKTQKTRAKTKPQSASDKIVERQRELRSLQKSIESDRVRIASLREKERSTTKAIAQYRQHSRNIQRYMELLQEEIESLQDKAETAKTASSATAGDLWRLRKRYAVLVQNMMRNDQGVDSPLMSRPTTGIDAVAEAQALQRVSSKARVSFRLLADKRDSLSDVSEKLHTKSEMRAVLLAMKDSEQKELDHTIALTQKALSAIRNDKSAVLEHLRKTQASAAAVSSYIASMVKKEGTPKTKSSKTSSGSKGSDVAQSVIPSHMPVKAKSLPYPVASHRILHGFGTYRNTVSNTLTNNPGIDIATPQGTIVSSVAAGTVSLVHWLPGYGSVVIVDHHNGFRSVYANLSSVSVKQGQSISAQQSVGRSAEAIDGEFVHLEFWFEKQRLNPLTFLK